MAGSNLHFVSVSVDKNLDALDAIQSSIQSKHDKKEDTLPDDDPFLPKLIKEIEVVNLIMKLHNLGPAKQGDSLKEEDKHWQQIKSDYPKLSVNLRQVLKPMLLWLRVHLKYNEVKDSDWDVKSVEWWDEVDYTTTLNLSK